MSDTLDPAQTCLEALGSGSQHSPSRYRFPIWAAGRSRLTFFLCSLSCSFTSSSPN